MAHSFHIQFEYSSNWKTYGMIYELLDGKLLADMKFQDLSGHVIKSYVRIIYLTVSQFLLLIFFSISVTDH